MLTKIELLANDWGGGGGGEGAIQTMQISFIVRMSHDEKPVGNFFTINHRFSTRFYSQASISLGYFLELKEKENEKRWDKIRDMMMETETNWTCFFVIVRKDLSNNIYLIVINEPWFFNEAPAASSLFQQFLNVSVLSQISRSFAR